MNKISLLAYMALTVEAQGPIAVVPAPTVSNFPFTQGGHPVVMTIKNYPSEMGYKITGKTDEAVGIKCEKYGYTGTQAYNGDHYGEQPAEACALKQGKYELQCLDDEADGWHGGFLVIDGKRYCDDFLDGHKKVVEFSICHDALPITQKQLDVELDYFSRSFDKHHYYNAMNLYAELKKKGVEPVTGPNGVHTWDLYDKAFPFEKVRRYDLGQQHMDEIQHFQDNLNQNLQNGQAVDQFIIVGKAAEAALNAKYHNGEFTDLATFDPEDAHPTTWATAKFNM
jgi:hypothetical protein